jgi:ABC-type multidrug transport system fused ATPase/permease subunit
MAKRFNEKREKALLASIDKELDSGYGKVDSEAIAAFDARDAAMGKGEVELFEKKLSKEEKKAAAKAAREAKKKAKGDGIKGSKSSENIEDMEEEEKKSETNGSYNNSSNGNDDNKKTELDMAALEAVLKSNELSIEEQQDVALEWLSSQQIAVTYTPKKGKIHANTRDINVSGVTVNFHGKPLIEETDVIINYGNRYGFIGPNGSGKVCSVFIVILSLIELVLLKSFVLVSLYILTNSKIDSLFSFTFE